MPAPDAEAAPQPPDAPKLPNPHARTLPRRPRPVALALCALNWVVPGAGYIATGNVRRGIALFVLINGIFAVGIAFGGYILDPVWNVRSPQFSAVALLTYVLQMFHGGGLLLTGWARDAAEAGRVTGVVEWLAGAPGRTHSDFGVFHLVVAGALNYFATMQLYDCTAGIPGHELAAAEEEARLAAEAAKAGAEDTSRAPGGSIS